MNKSLVFTYLLIIICLNSKSQDDEKYDDFILKNKIYRPYAGYVLAGFGMGYNYAAIRFERNFFLSYNFRIKNHFFKTGYHNSSDQFFMKRSYELLNDIYYLYGYRNDRRSSNIGLYIGPSYAFGSTLAYVKDYDGRISNWYRRFYRTGIYAVADLTYKPFYDIGIGISAYASINSIYTVAGLQFNLYFSSSYRGSIE